MREGQWIETVCWVAALLAVPAGTAGAIWLVGKMIRNPAKKVHKQKNYQEK